MINGRSERNKVSVIGLVLIVCFSALAHPFSQDKKAIVRRLTLTKEPVAVTFTLKGEPAQTSESVNTEEAIRTEEFAADADWLKDLSLKLKNTSGKTITYVVVNLRFPEVTRNVASALHQIFLGVDPDGKFQRPEFRLAANETIDVPLASRYEAIKKLLKTTANTPVENVGKLSVEFHSALFDDGTLFQAGVYYRRDQNDPHSWTAVKN